MRRSSDVESCLRGERLYGDDFDQEQICAWYADEAEGYAGLVQAGTSAYQYVYHALNERHGFRHIGDRSFQHCLGLGSAYGHELLPLSVRIARITILDASESFAVQQEIQGTPCSYQPPLPTGDLPFPNGRFDLLTCLGVLHHIPNVTHVMRECYRCLEPGGVMLLREPVCSLGDWRHPRRGLTRRERGIPLDILDGMVEATGFRVEYRALCIFPLIPKCVSKLGVDAYNSPLLTWLDDGLSRLFAWNIRYHRIGVFQKLAPASVYYVLIKPVSEEACCLPET